MGNISNTRFPNGLTNVGETNLFADMVQPDPTLFHEYMQDFDQYVAGDWTVTATGSTTQALAAGNGGWLLVTNSASNADVCQVQKLPASFAITAGKRMFFRARFKVNDATASTVIVGLQNTNTDATTATNGIYFSKAAAAKNVSIISRFNTTTGSTSVAAITAMADDTFIELGFFVGVNGGLLYEINGAVVGSVANAVNFQPTTNMAPVMYIKNGAAAAKTLTTDYVYVAVER